MVSAAPLIDTCSGSFNVTVRGVPFVLFRFGFVSSAGAASCIVLHEECDTGHLPYFDSDRNGFRQ
jgi:hypothetical protein